MRKLTHEEFLNRLQQVNPNIEVLGTYTGTDNKIKCKCKIDGYEWETTPYRLLKKGVGCPKCNNKIRRTHEEFMQELAKRNEHFNNIIIKNKFIKNKTPMECECKICGYTWTAPAERLLHQGSGCPKCANKIIAQKQTRTHEQFMQEFYEKNPNAQDITILNHYVNSSTKILCKCKKDGYEWSVRPAGLLRGSGCRKCAGSLKKTHEQFMQEFYENNTHAKDIEILSKYVNYMSKLKVKCKICGNEWEVMAGSLLRNIGCPRCYFNRIAKEQARTHEEFLEVMQENHPDIKVLGEYKNARFKIKFRCKVCGNEWYTQPEILLRGSGCPKCNTSKGEKRIAQYLDNLGINYIYDKRYFKDLYSTSGTLLRPDFILPSLKIWIEYDGRQHFEPVDFSSKLNEQQLQEQFEKVQQNDLIKNQYAKDNNWTLIRIPFTEYDNIEQILADYIEQEEQVI